MSRQKVAANVRETVRQAARYRCGYCLLNEILTGLGLEIEHIIPVSLGGTNDEDNLWLSCRNCNGAKYTQTEALDPATNLWVELFNPRTQNWHDHFVWSDDGTLVVGLSSIGRATVEALRLNQPRVVASRRSWVRVGWWPPVD